MAISQTLLRAVRAEVDVITDRLGMPIDEGIKDAVVAFRACGFPTSASCEGHAGRGAPYPWVEIYIDGPAGWEKLKGKARARVETVWRKKNLPYQQKMATLLAAFYKRRATPFDARLVFDAIGIFGGFRVQSFGARYMSLFSRKEQMRKRELYRKEMNAFARFLRV